METCFLQHLSILKQPRECQNRCWLTLDKGQLPISILHQFERIQAMTDACHYTLNFPENLDIKVIIVKILMSLISLQFWVISKITFLQTAIQPFSAKSCLDRSSLPGGLHVRGEAKVIVKKMHLYIPSPEIYSLHKLSITESNYIQKKYWYQNINTDDN